MADLQQHRQAGIQSTLWIGGEGSERFQRALNKLHQLMKRWDYLATSEHAVGRKAHSDFGDAALDHADDRRPC